MALLQMMPNPRSVTTATPAMVVRLEQENPFRILDFEEIENLPSPPALVERVLMDRTLTVLAGKMKVGKSLVALDLALSIHHGIPWAGFTTRQGSVVYIAAEGYEGTKKRIRAWNRMHRLESSKLKVLPQAVQLGVPRQVEYLIDAIRAKTIGCPPALVIIDTLARCAVGIEENSALGMGLVVHGAETIIRELETSVLLVHHLGKNGEVRGSSALESAADQTIIVEPGKIKSKFSKDDEPFGTVPFKILKVGGVAAAWTQSGKPPANDADGGRIEQVTLSSKTTTKTSRTSHSQQKSLDVLVQGGGTLSAGQWKKAAEAAGISTGTHYRHRRKLLEEGLVAESGGSFSIV